MSKRTYVCLPCRTAKRADAAYGLNTDFRCARCRGNLFELPWKWRIPKQNDDREWRKLEKMVSEMERDWLPRRHAVGDALLKKIDAQIAATLRRTDSEAKMTKLRYLRWQRSEVEKKYKTST